MALGTTHADASLRQLSTRRSFDEVPAGPGFLHTDPAPEPAADSEPWASAVTAFRIVRSD